MDNLSNNGDVAQMAETQFVEEFQELQEPQPASSWRRLLGFIVDYLVIFFLLALITNDQLMVELFIVLAYPLYCVIFESIFSRTLGKLLTGTIVVRLRHTKTVFFEKSPVGEIIISYNKPSFWRILGRNFSKLIPFALIFLFHDSISKTMVTTVKELRIYRKKTESSAKKEEPKCKKSLKTKRFKSLNKGVQRLLIVLWVLLPLFIGIMNDFEEDGWIIFLVMLVLYWPLIFTGLWIYNGFKEKGE